jgi:Domain of unknown function (DUF4440)
MASRAEEIGGAPTPIQVLAEYYRAFSTLDIDAILPYFHEPSMLIGPQGVFAAPTRGVLAATIAPAIDGLRARDFGRSELSVRQVRSLSANAALVIGVAIRYRRGGEELERVGVTYVLHLADGGWKIAVLILHELDETAPRE